MLGLVGAGMGAAIVPESAAGLHLHGRPVPALRDRARKPGRAAHGVAPRQRESGARSMRQLCAEIAVQDDRSADVARRLAAMPAAARSLRRAAATRSRRRVTAGCAGCGRAACSCSAASATAPTPRRAGSAARCRREPWAGIADATRYGRRLAPDRRPSRRARTACSSTSGRRRCDRGRRPVMVYIHGGAYSHGLGLGSALRRRAASRSAATWWW